MLFTNEQNPVQFKAVDDVVVLWIADRTISGNLYQEMRKSVARALYTIDSADFDIYINYIMEHLQPGTIVSLIVESRLIDRLLAISLQNVISIYGLGSKFFLRWKNTKVRDVFYDMNSKNIVKILEEDFKAHFNQQWSMGVSIFQTNTEVQRAMGELSHQNAQFMWYQLLVKILTQMPSSPRSKDDMLQQSFLNYKEDKTMKDFQTYENYMHELKRHYDPNDAIQWYTRDTFVYRLLNQTCRTSEINMMFSYRFLIRDIFLQLRKLYIEQEEHFVPITVYRATQVSQEELEMLQRNVGNLISRHQFLSTTMDKQVALAYADNTPTTLGEALFILEEIKIDPDKCKTTPYASVGHCSLIKSEREILLSIGSVFRVKSISKAQDKNLWTVELELTDNDEKPIKELHDYLELNIDSEPSLLTLSIFLLWMGKYDKARQYCDILLTQLDENHRERPEIYTQIGYICQKMGKFDEALQYLNQSVEGFQNLSDEPTTIKLSCAYNDRGLIHQCRGEYQDALSDIHKALEMRQDKENLTERERASLAVYRSHAHENLGILYKDTSEYELALHHLQKTLDLRQKYLPSNHHWIAQTYNNLSLVYTAMNNRKMMVECIKKAIDIQRQSLPENHPHLATMYQTQANVYYQQGEYAEALTNFQHAYDMYQSMPYCDPLMVAAALSNVGSAMKATGNYAAALPKFEEALDTQRRFAPKHPNIIRALNNMAMVCRHMGDINAFMNYSQEALRMCREISGEYHEITAITYSVYASRLDADQYDLAMDCFSRVLDTYIQHLHLPYHKNVILCYLRMGIMERKRGQFEQAHHYFNQAIETFGYSLLPKQHFLLTEIYEAMALTHVEQGQVNAALYAYEQGIEHAPADYHELPKIRQAIETLRRNHITTNSNNQEHWQRFSRTGVVGIITIISIMGIILFKIFRKT